MIVWNIIKRIFGGDTLGIILVIGAVLVFSFFDPFGWFVPGPKLKGTSILVREVKSIGELISAEYYGEAIGSYDKARLEEHLQDTTIIKKLADDIINDLDSLYDLQNPSANQFRWSEGKTWRRYKKYLRDKFKNNTYYPFMVDLYGGEKNFIKKTIFNNNRSSLKDSEDFLKSSQLSSIISNQASDAQSRKEKRKNVVAIGRGIVRAGVDLTDIDEDDFLLYGSELLIRSAKPEILSVEMNPWFIPERKVKGFEILKLKGKVNQEDLLFMKTDIRNKIRRQAEVRDIVAQAKTNAEDALLSFFSLLDDNITKVRLLYEPLDIIMYDLRKDSTSNLSPEYAVYLLDYLHTYVSEYQGAVNTDSVAMVVNEIKSRYIRPSFHKLSLAKFDSIKQDTTNIALDSTSTVEVIHVSLDAIKADAYNIYALNEYYDIKPSLTLDTAYLESYWLTDSAKFSPATYELRKQLIENEVIESLKERYEQQTEPDS